ncbi:DNA-directed RNA polymerase subunit beta' [Erythrobacter sp.]|jgi:hypothetical protein|uniref:DNA-directed RNA polymerase subunit beta' n=1 Tax=Erythrobacter sp. TaxID=1042 RepID=UPI002EA1A395|nr:DNA-directed RNA polymerase subunit beta' [Erythrobacter sp.]
MPTSHLSPLTSKRIIARLAAPAPIAEAHPIAARFVYALRLIAVHERAGRDPVPELAARLGSVIVAAKALTLAQAITTCWPDDIHLSRFCCGWLSHDEATIAQLVEAAAARDRARGDRALEGFVRRRRIERLWIAASELVIAELSAA